MNDFDIELKLLLEAIYLKYQHDFRHYACRRCGAGCRRRSTNLGCTTLSQLQDRILRDGDGSRGCSST